MTIKYHKDGTSPTGKEVFVFGSNLQGIHGSGAAREALDNFKAIYGQGTGFQGQSYALPTKLNPRVSLSLEQIADWVERFKKDVLARPGTEFWITRVGCVLAGYGNKDIAPLFKGFPENCSFPDTWKEYLEE